MLQSMRNLAQSWLVKGLMLILIVSFGIWGIGDIFRGNPLQRKIAKAGSEAITVQALDRAFETKLAEVREKMGGELSAQRAKQLGLLDQTLNELIDRAEIEQGIRALGLEISDKDAYGWLASRPAFRNKDGSFNRELFQRALDQSRMDESHFLTEEKKSLMGQELIRSFESGGGAPQTVADPLVAARGQKRILDVVTVMDGGIRDVPAPDDKALQEFYKDHPADFTAPEYRSLTIARLSTGDVAKGVSISDDQLQKEYDAHSAQFAHPERRDILQVVMQDEGKAKRIAAAARAGGNLANAAGGVGSKTVPLDGLEEKTMLPELAKTVFALKSGQVSDPVKSPLGWHVIQLKKITPAGTPEFRDVKEQLRETMQRDQAIDAATRMVNQMDDELAAGHALEDIADEMKLRLIKIPAVTVQGKTPENKDPAELPAKADVLKAAFGQNAGDTSPIIDDKNGDYVVVRTDQVTPSALRPFDAVKDQVTAMWRTQEQAKLAAAEAETIAKGLREGKAPSSFAAQSGVEVRVSKPVSLLGDQDPGLPSSILPQVMGMKKGEVITADLPDRQLVLRLADLADLDKTAADAVRARVSAEIDRQLSDELSDEYLKYLHTLFPVSVDQDALDVMRQQGG